MGKVKQDLIDACALVEALRGEMEAGIQPDVDGSGMPDAVELERRNEVTAVGKAFQKARLELVGVAKQYVEEST